MPRVRIRIPDELLQRAADHARDTGTTIDALYGEAVAAYVERNRTASPGSLRSRSGIPLRSPSLTVEIPEELFQRADKLAKRLGKRREVLYAEALARLVMHVRSGDSALDQGHDLPTGAWREKGSG